MIIECKTCEALVDAKTIADLEPFDPESPPSKFTFASCPICTNPILMVQEDFGDGWDSPLRVYPPNESQLNHTIPQSIRNAYSEALACIKVKANTAAAIMCRKTLEAICKEHGAQGNNLVTSLKELKDKNIIESRLFDWADALRIYGNEAAHDINTAVTSEEARDLLEFTNALLGYVFTFRDKFEEFKKRRMKKLNLKSKV